MITGSEKQALEFGLFVFEYFSLKMSPDTDNLLNKTLDLGKKLLLKWDILIIWLALKQGEDIALKFVNIVTINCVENEKIILYFAKILEKSPRLLEIAMKGVVEV